MITPGLYLPRPFVRRVESPQDLYSSPTGKAGAREFPSV